MSVRRKTTMFICGGDFTPATRTDCPNPLHNWPLARGYVDASNQAARRLRTGWTNTHCKDCELYGWTPGKLHEDDTLVLPPKNAS